MISKILLAVFAFSATSAFAQMTVYNYELQVEETTALEKDYHGNINLVPADQPRQTKKYNCKLEVKVVPSNQVFKGKWGDYGLYHAWKFTAREQHLGHLTCDFDKARATENSMYFYQGVYEETLMHDDRPARPTETYSGYCSSGKTQTMKGSTPNIGPKLLFETCEAVFNPLGRFWLTGQTFAYFLKATNPDSLISRGYTKSLLKLENGKLSGYSDEVLFSGTYQLK